MKLEGACVSAINDHTGMDACLKVAFPKKYFIMTYHMEKAGKFTRRRHLDINRLVLESNGMGTLSMSLWHGGRHVFFIT